MNPILAIAAVHVVVFLGSSFHERVPRAKRAASGDRSTEIGKSAGRVVGSGVKSARKLFSGDGK